MPRLRRVQLTRSAIVVALLVFSPVAIISPRTQPAQPTYVAFGDSIDFGIGDDFLADGFGYVPLFANFLSSAVFGTPVDVHNFAIPGAGTADILKHELPSAATALMATPIVVTWGGGGNDLLGVIRSPQAAACRQDASCLGRFTGLLENVEQTIDRTMRELREAVGSSGRVLMRTQYNALLRTGCAVPELAALAHVTLEGAPGTVLDRGLNDRIRDVAARYDAQVIDLYLPFASNPDLYVSSDCVHPTGAGYQVIAAVAQQVYSTP